MAASGAAAAGVPETWEQYEARLVEFLRLRGAGGCPMSTLGMECAYAPAHGEKGFFRKLVRAKPHLFEFADPDCAFGPRVLRLAAAMRQPPAPRAAALPAAAPPQPAAAPAAAPPAKAWLAAEDELYASRLVAYLRESGKWHDIYALSKACQMPSHLLFEHSSQGQGFFRRFLIARPQLFQLVGPNVRLAASEPPMKQAAASEAPVSGAASSSESEYEARLVAYLRQTTGGELVLANIDSRCPWPAAKSKQPGNGKGSGVYSAFVRARPHLFELVPREHGQHIVRLVEGQKQAKAVPPQQQQPQQAAPPAEPQPASGSEAEYEARLIAFIRSQPTQAVLISSIGLRCPWSAARGVHGAYKAFVRARPHQFQCLALEHGGDEVRLVQQGPTLRAAASPQAAKPPQQSRPLPKPHAASPQAAPPPQQARPLPKPCAVPPYTPPAEPAYVARSLLPPAPPSSLLPPAPPASVAAPSLPPLCEKAPAPAEVSAPSLPLLLPSLPVPLPLPLLPQWGPPPPPPLPTALPPFPAGGANCGTAAPAAPPRVLLSGPAELRSSPGGATATIELTLVNAGAATVVVCSAAIHVPRPDLRLLPATPLPRVLVPEGKLVLALQHSGEAPCVADVVVECRVESTNDRWWIPNAPQPQTAVATAAITLRCA